MPTFNRSSHTIYVPIMNEEQDTPLQPINPTHNMSAQKHNNIAKTATIAIGAYVAVQGVQGLREQYFKSTGNQVLERNMQKAQTGALFTVMLKANPKVAILMAAKRGIDYGMNLIDSRREKQNSDFELELRGELSDFNLGGADYD